MYTKTCRHYYFSPLVQGSSFDRDNSNSQIVSFRTASFFLPRTAVTCVHEQAFLQSPVPDGSLESNVGNSQLYCIFLLPKLYFSHFFPRLEFSLNGELYGLDCVAKYIILCRMQQSRFKLTLIFQSLPAPEHFDDKPNKWLYYSVQSNCAGRAYAAQNMQFLGIFVVKHWTLLTATVDYSLYLVASLKKIIIPLCCIFCEIRLN